MVSMKNIVFYIMTIITILFWVGCEKELINPSAEKTVTVNGIVLNEDGVALNGVSLSFGTASATSDVSGAFSVTGAVSGERGILIAELPGYMKGSYSFLAEANKNYTTKVILGQADVSTTLPSATGGIVSLSSGAQVVIPANAVTRMDGSTYNGTTVKVDVKEINEDLGAAFSAQIPGITLSAININNEEQELVSYGMLTVELYGDNNEALQLADGQTSELTFTIPAGQQASAPATIPLWYFDETIGLWREDGYATKQGNQYKGNVSHFTTWNCDQPHPPCTISGCLEDDLGNAQANITLQIGQITTQTDANGCFSASVPAQFLPINISFTDYVQMQSCLLYTLSSVINPSVNYNLGTIVLSNLNCISLTVSTLPVVNISTTATSGGNITNNGGPPITQRGVVWSTTPNPTTANNNTIDGSGTGSFSSTLTGLTANTTYYVRAYATNSAGTAYGNEVSFTTTAGGSGTVHCTGTPTAVVDVTNPSTGKIWMDRNLGASQAATSSTDANSYGDLYQWGRRADGHQCRTSPTTATLSSTDQPAHGDFITIDSGNYDWRSPQNDNLWQGVNGINNPCPSGYRLPTNAELDAERASWSQNNSAGAFASPLKLPRAGNREASDGSLYVGSYGEYWSSTVGTGANSEEAGGLIFSSSSAYMLYNDRAEGLSVRCIKD